MGSSNGGGSISNDLFASFKATGIFPINKHEILEKIPNEENSKIIKDTVIEYQKSQRYTNNDENASKKRKKIMMAAEASITSTTLGLNDAIYDEESEENNLPIITNDSESDHEAIIDG